MVIKDQVDTESKYIWEFKKTVGDNFKTKGKDGATEGVNFHPNSEEWILFSDKYEIHEYQKAFNKLYKDLRRIYKNEKKAQKQSEKQEEEEAEVEAEVDAEVEAEVEAEGEIPEEELEDAKNDKNSKSAEAKPQQLDIENEEKKAPKDDISIKEKKGKKKKNKKKNKNKKQKQNENENENEKEQGPTVDPTKDIPEIEFEYTVKRPNLGNVKYKGVFTKQGIKNLYDYISTKELPEEGVNLGLYVTLMNNKTREIRWFDCFKKAGFTEDHFKGLRIVVEKEPGDTVQELDENHPLKDYSFEEKCQKAFEEFFKLGVDA